MDWNDLGQAKWHGCMADISSELGTLGKAVFGAMNILRGWLKQQWDKGQCHTGFTPQS